MPPHKDVEPLKHMCFLLIAKDIHEVAVDLEENENPKYMDKEALYALASNLPSIFVEQIIVKVVETNIRNVQRSRRTIGLETCLEVLLQPHVTKLDLGGLFFKMRLPVHINTNIRNVVCQSVCKMQNLVYLNLVSKCDDKILLSISKYCKNIVTIVISISDLVTDEGIRFISNDCPNLEKLEIYKCWGVSAIGVKYALLHSKNLKELHCDELGHVFLQYLKNTNQQFKLRHFEQTYTNFEPSVEEAVWLGHVCPEIESVRLATEDDCLFCLSKLGKGLKIVELELTSVVGSGFSSAIPEVSSTLTTLNLSCEVVHQKHITLVGEICKNLVTFHLTTATVDQDEDLRNTGEYFTNLTSLHLQVWKETFINAALTEFFLMWCHKLNYVVLKAQMDFFTDNYLRKILEANPFQQVMKINITSDKYVPLTTRSVDMLMASCPLLESLSVSSWDVGEEEFFQLVKSLKENNYNLSVT